MPLGRTPIIGSMTVRDALLNVINEDMAELFSRVETLELGGFSGVAIATEEEAIAGVDNTKAMTPLRTRQAIAANPSGYLTTASHTKALHDSLGIDADTLDGQHASAFLQSASHTKALHDSLGIDADTLDGDHGSAFRRIDESIYLSQGQIVDFEDEDGDKIRLNGTQYGIAINTNELTLYVPPSAEIAVRDSAYNGQKLGDLIHTANMLDKGVSMPLARMVSTAGDYPVLRITGSAAMGLGVYSLTMRLMVPWTGTTRYTSVINNGNTSTNTIYIKINTVEYGPFSIGGGSSATINVDYTTSEHVEVAISHKASLSNAGIAEISVKTGNADIMYKVGISYWRSGFTLTA